MQVTAAERDLLELCGRAAVVEELLAAVRHDVRNKLAAVRNASFYVRRRLGKTEVWAADPRLDQMCDVLEQEVDAANVALEATPLLDRIRTRAVASVDGAECVRRAVACLRVLPSSPIEIQATPGPLYVDAAEVSLVVREVVENAIEAGARAVEVRAHPVDGMYAVEVADDGAGIPREQNERVFDPFFTTKPGRAGLGLAIAARIARRYRGALFSADAERGSLVVLRLPFEEASHGDIPRR